MYSVYAVFLLLCEFTRFCYTLFIAPKPAELQASSRHDPHSVQLTK